MKVNTATAGGTTLVLIVIVFVGAILFSMGCSALDQQRTADLNQPKEVRLTERQGACGSGVGINVGDTLELEMASDLEGYMWDIGFNVPAVLKVTGWPSPDAGSGAGGASHTNTFHLTAVGEGEEALRMIYRSSIDRSALPLKICDVKVSVTQ